MIAPKLLPWMARKVGISDELAMKLWRRAVGESEKISDFNNNANCYSVAMENFIDLLEEESGKPIRDSNSTNESRWILNYQKRLLISNCELLNVMCQFWKYSLGVSSGSHNLSR